jgi:hypothetical protein
MGTRQMHIRLTESEYLFLTQQAAEADESVNHLVRRLIRTQMRGDGRTLMHERENRTTVVSSVLRRSQT